MRRKEKEKEKVKKRKEKKTYLHLLWYVHEREHRGRVLVCVQDHKRMPLPSTEINPIQFQIQFGMAAVTQATNKWRCALVLLPPTWILSR